MPLSSSSKPELSGTKWGALAPLFAFPLDPPVLFCNSMPEDLVWGSRCGVQLSYSGVRPLQTDDTH